MKFYLMLYEASHVVAKLVSSSYLAGPSNVANTNSMMGGMGAVLHSFSSYMTEVYTSTL